MYCYDLLLIRIQSADSDWAILKTIKYAFFKKKSDRRKQAKRFKTPQGPRPESQQEDEAGTTNTPEITDRPQEGKQGMLALLQAMQQF